jgi:hypothetical protein
MRVTLKFDAYNARRYSRPWIAKVVDWPIGKPPALAFGGLVGLTAEIEAEPGQLIRWGQRDNRGNKSTSCWGIVDADGDVCWSTPEACRKQWLAGCPVPPREDDAGDNVVPLRGA